MEGNTGNGNGDKTMADMVRDTLQKEIERRKNVSVFSTWMGVQLTLLSMLPIFALFVWVGARIARLVFGG